MTEHFILRGRTTSNRAVAMRMLACCSVLTAGLVGAIATPASASPPTSVTAVSVTTDTAAVGALATYTVGFTTSASGALAANTGSVTVTFPSGTDTTSVSNSAP